MILKEIVSNELHNCYDALHNDAELNSIDREFYGMADTIGKENMLKLESMFTNYAARTARIAYLQGMKDFRDLCITLSQDTDEIMKKYIDL